MLKQFIFGTLLTDFVVISLTSLIITEALATLRHYDLTKDQEHWKYFQLVQPRENYKHSMFKRNRRINIWTKAIFVFNEVIEVILILHQWPGRRGLQIHSMVYHTDWGWPTLYSRSSAIGQEFGEMGTAKLSEAHWKNHEKEKNKATPCQIVRGPDQQQPRLPLFHSRMGVTNGQLARQKLSNYKPKVHPLELGTFAHPMPAVEFKNSSTNWHTIAGTSSGCLKSDGLASVKH